MILIGIYACISVVVSDRFIEIVWLFGFRDYNECLRLTLVRIFLLVAFLAMFIMVVLDPFLC